MQNLHSDLNAGELLGKFKEALLRNPDVCMVSHSEPDVDQKFFVALSVADVFKRVLRAQELGVPAVDLVKDGLTGPDALIKELEKFKAAQTPAP